MSRAKVCLVTFKIITFPPSLAQRERLAQRRISVARRKLNKTSPYTVLIHNSTMDGPMESEAIRSFLSNIEANESRNTFIFREGANNTSGIKLIGGELGTQSDSHVFD